MDEKISLTSEFQSDKNKWLIKQINWNNRQYNIEKLGLYYREKRGKGLYHIFFVCSKQLCFKLELEAEKLIWRLTEISDGLPE